MFDVTNIVLYDEIGHNRTQTLYESNIIINSTIENNTQLASYVARGFKQDQSW